MDNALLVTTLVSTVLPLLVGLLTKSSTPKDVKFVLLSILTAVNVAGTSFLSGTTDVKTLAFSAVCGLLVALGTHYGIYKPTGLAQKAQDTLVKDAPEPDAEAVAAAEAEWTEEVDLEDVGQEAYEAAEEGDAPAEAADTEEAKPAE